MDIWVLLLIIATAAVGGLTGYYRGIAPGVDAIRNLFENKKIVSVNFKRGWTPDDKRSYELRLTNAAGDSLLYYFRSCESPFAETNDTAWEKEVRPAIEGYAAWQISFFAWILSRQKSMVYGEVILGHGDEGWQLKLA